MALYSKKIFNLSMDLLLGSLGDKMSPTLDNHFSPNAEAILIQLLIVMTSMKSKGRTINANRLKQLVKGRSYESR